MEVTHNYEQVSLLQKLKNVPIQREHIRLFKRAVHSWFIQNLYQFTVSHYVYADTAD